MEKRTLTLIGDSCFKWGRVDLGWRDNCPIVILYHSVYLSLLVVFLYKPSLKLFFFGMMV